MSKIWFWFMSAGADCAGSAYKFSDPFGCAQGRPVNLCSKRFREPRLRRRTIRQAQDRLLQRLSRSQQKWIPLTKLWALPITTNAAEHIFRCLRRYTKPMGHFGAEAATQRFFDLFAVYHNLRILREGKRAGNSLLATSLIDVEQLFGSADPYTILGFPPASRFFVAVKSVQPI